MTDAKQSSGGIDPAFGAGMDQGDQVVLAERVKELEGQVESLTKERDDALDAATSDDRVAVLTEERDAAVARAEKAEKALKAKPKAVAAKDAEAKPRRFKLSPRPDGVDPDENQAFTDDLRSAIEGADDVEIAFIDADGRELPGSRPVSVSGNVWKPHALGLMQAEPVEFEAPAGSTSAAVAGYALILDGKVVATRMRSEPVPVAPGQKIKLVDDIVF